MLSGEGNENGEKTIVLTTSFLEFSPTRRSVGRVGENPRNEVVVLISKKATLPVHWYFFFYISLPVVSHDYNVKLPETS